MRSGLCWTDKVPRLPPLLTAPETSWVFIMMKMLLHQHNPAENDQFPPGYPKNDARLNKTLIGKMQAFAEAVKWKNEDDIKPC